MIRNLHLYLKQKITVIGFVFMFRDKPNMILDNIKTSGNNDNFWGMFHLFHNESVGPLQIIYDILLDDADSHERAFSFQK